MKTPFGIHAEYVSDRAVNNCINMYKKDQNRVMPGTIGGGAIKGIVKPDIKDSLDLGLSIDEIHALLEKQKIY